MTAAEYTAGLRDFADWIDANAGVLEEESYSLDETLNFRLYGFNAEQFAGYIRIIGKGVKVPDDRWMNVQRRFGPVLVETFTDRGTVCRKVVTATREITREISDPDAPTVTVTETVEDYDWICEESLLAHLPDAEASA
jgi:hypothetical protein